LFTGDFLLPGVRGAFRQLVVIVRQTELERSDKDRANEEKRGTDRDEA